MPSSLRHAGKLFPLIAVLLAGCASAPETRRDTDRTARERAAVQRVLKDIFDAAAKKELQRLDSYHAYGPNFTKFGEDQLGRQDSAQAREGEHRGLTALADLAMQADELKIDVFGNAAIATFIMNYRFTAGNETVAHKSRATLVFVKDRGDWKIAHEHFSALKANP